MIRAGDAGDRFYLIVSGEVEVLSPNPAETGGVLATLGPGAYFGEIALLRDVPRIATVRARTDLALFSLDRDALKSLLSANPGLRLQLEDVIQARESEARAIAGVAAPSDITNKAVVATLEVDCPLGGTKLVALNESRRQSAATRRTISSSTMKRFRAFTPVSNGLPAALTKFGIARARMARSWAVSGSRSRRNSVTGTNCRSEISR